MNSSIKELKDRYVSEFYPNEVEQFVKMKFDGFDFYKDITESRIFNDFDMDDTPKYDSNRPTDYSQGDDYHAYVSLNLQTKENADVKAFPKSTKKFISKGRYPKEAEKYCLHNYCSNGTLNTIRKEYSNYLVSKQLTKPSIIKTNFNNPQRILQNYRYIPHKNTEDIDILDLPDISDLSEEFIQEFNSQTSVTDLNRFYDNVLYDSSIFDEHCDNSSNIIESDSDSSVYMNSSSESINQSNKNGKKKSKSKTFKRFKTFLGRLVSRKTPTQDQPRQDIMTNEVLSNYPTSSEMLKDVHFNKTDPKEKSLLIKGGDKKPSEKPSLDKKTPRTRNPVKYLFNKVKRRRKNSSDSSTKNQDKYGSMDIAKSLQLSPVKSHFNRKLTFEDLRKPEINDESIVQDTYISQSKEISKSLKRQYQPESNEELTFQEPYISEECFLFEERSEEDNKFDSETKDIFYNQHVVIDGLEYYYFEPHFKMTTKKSLKTFKKVVNSVKGSSMFSSNLQMWLNVFRPSLDLLWNFYLDCPKTELAITLMQTDILNMLKQIKMAHRNFLESQIDVFPTEYSTDVLYMISTLFTIYLGFIGVLNRLQDVTGFRRLLKDLFYVTFKRFESEVMHYPFLDYHFTE